MPTPSRLTPDYRWNEAARQYIAPNGRFVKRSQVVKALESAIAGSRSEIDRLSGALANEEISIAQWQLGMAEEIKTIHTCSAAAARGGWAQMSQSDWGYVGSQLKEQYRYLDNFASEIESGAQKLNGNFLRRARMYADSGRGTGESMRGRMARNAAFIEESRVLGVADHCPDCVLWAGWGWRPIGTLPKIGASRCRTNCKCHFEYRNEAGEIFE